MKIKNLTLTFLTFFILACSSALAIPPIPCTFFGTVSIDGNPVNGTLVTVHRNSTGEYLATAKEPPAGFGHYTVAVTAAGEYIRFKVNGVWADQPEQYCESGNFTYLNLTLSCTDCDGDGYNYTVDCNDDNPNIHPGAVEVCNALDDNCDGTIDNFTESCYTGPAGTLNVGVCRAGSHTCTNGVWNSCTGEVKPTSEVCNSLDDDCDGYVDDGVCGGGGVQTTTTTTTTTTLPAEETTTTTIAVCQERWVCSDWSACVNKLQTRTCTDENNCGTDLNKPLESQPCSTTEGGNQTTGGTTISPITGFFAALAGNPLYYIGIVVVIILIVLFLPKYGLYHRRR
jgi:hypothetical protein